MFFMWDAGLQKILESIQEAGFFLVCAKAVTGGLSACIRKRYVLSVNYRKKPDIYSKYLWGLGM